MKEKLVLVIIFLVFGCKTHNKEQNEADKIKHYEIENKHEYNTLVSKDFEVFDIKRFDKNKDEAEDYIYTLMDGSRIREFGYKERGYFSECSNGKSLYSVGKAFYANGNIQAKGPKFKDDCEIGIWYEFDESEKLVKETDYDKPFKIIIEDILEFLKKNEADLFSDFTFVNRSFDEKTKKGTWNLRYRGKYKENVGMFIVEIDDASAEVTKVIKILGKEGEKEIIFEKK